MSRYRVIGFLGALLVLSAHNAGAVDRDWNQTSGTQVFNNAGNWTPGAVPLAGDNLTFGLDGDVDIFLGAPSVGNDITFIDGIVEFLDVGGSTLNSGGIVTIDDVFAVGLGGGAQVILNSATWDNAGDATIGDIGFGSLTINNGGDFEANQVLVGNQAGGVGELTLTDTGTIVTASLLSNVGIITAGNAGGTGTINVFAGANLRTASTSGNDIWVGSGVDPNNGANGSTGTLNVDGVGSFAETEDLQIGRFGGTGFLNITGGGQIINTDGGTNGNPDTFIGINSGSVGTAVIDGDGSMLRSRSINISWGGSTGTLAVRNGGVARTLRQGTALGHASIGTHSGGDGQVAVYGTATDGTTASLFDVDDSLWVGDNGLGVLRIGQELDGTANGAGALQVDVDLRIGDDTTNTENNRVVVDGANATANVDNDTYVGLSGTGTLEVTGGAQFTGRFLRVGQNSTSNGTLIINGADSLLDTDADTTDVTDNTIIGFSGTGNATVSNGGRLNTDALWVGYQGSSVGTLTIDGGTVNAGVDNQGTGSDLIIGGRTDAGGGGTGTVTIENGGVLTSAVLTIIGGNATATGTLTITGAGSLLDNSDNGPNTGANDTLRVGQSGGTAFLNILDGGRLHTEAAWTGLGSGTNAATIVVDGVGSTFETDNFLRIGDGRESLFTVSNGGTLNVATSAAPGASNNRLIVGFLDGGDGAKLTVTGTDSLIDYFGNDRISAGLSGGEANNRATIEVLDGARLNAVQRDVNNAVVSSGFLMVGDSTGSHGQVTVDGAGSRIDVRYMQVGDGTSDSSGIVDITGGGLLTTLDFVEVGSFGSGVGTLNVDGAGSTLAVGSYLSLGDDLFGGAADGASGTLNIADGGTVTNGTAAYIGHFTGSFGTATVGSTTADTSSWTIGGELTISGTETSSQLSGFGVLNLNPGGLVDVASSLRIRNLGDVNLDGGELRVGGSLIFTDAGSTLNFNSGTLRFTNATGFTLSSATLSNIFGGGEQTLDAGQHLAVDGTALIGAPIRINGGTLSLGSVTVASFSNVDFDAGTLNLTNSGLVVTAAGLFGSSLVIDEDETVNVSSSTFVQADGLLNVARGTFSAGAAVNEGTIVIAEGNANFDADDSGSGLTNNGNLVVIDSTIAGAIVNNGTIEIIGTVDFTDGVSLMAAGSLGIDLDGLANFDTLSVGGDLSLDGTLDVDVDSFLLTVGDSFEIIDVAGVLSGTFAGLADGALVGNFGGVDLFIDYDAGDGNDIALFTVADVDLDNDGDVDGVDFLAIQRTNPGLIPDWELQYGNGIPLAASSQAVPEPTTALLAIVAFVAILTVQRKENRPDTSGLA